MILCFILLILLAGCGKCEKGQSTQSAATAVYTSVDQLNGKNIGSATGTTYDEIVRRRLPDVTFSYYNTYAACQWGVDEADPGVDGAQRLLNHGEYLRAPGLQFQALVGPSHDERSGNEASDDVKTPSDRSDGAWRKRWDSNPRTGF